jgi:histidinol-phosphate phosphatase family protein
MINIDQDWTLFLDRDGVINKRLPNDYVKSFDQFHFEENVLEAIAEFTPLFQRIIIVTNQQGIAKGLMSEKDLINLHNQMCSEIVKFGGKIDAVFFAPGFKSKENMLRKPNTGMAQLAKNQFPEINFKKSIMAGDTDSDMVFGKKLGMISVQIFSEYETYSIKPNYKLQKLKDLPSILSK